MSNSDVTIFGYAMILLMAIALFNWLWVGVIKEYLKLRSKQAAIDFVKWATRKEAKYAPMFDGETWAGNETDISVYDLYELYEKKDLEQLDG